MLKKSWNLFRIASTYNSTYDPFFKKTVLGTSFIPSQICFWSNKLKFSLTCSIFAFNVSHIFQMFGTLNQCSAHLPNVPHTLSIFGTLTKCLAHFINICYTCFMFLTVSWYVSHFVNVWYTSLKCVILSQCWYDF